MPDTGTIRRPVPGSSFIPPLMACSFQNVRGPGQWKNKNTLESALVTVTTNWDFETGETKRKKILWKQVTGYSCIHWRVLLTAMTFTVGNGNRLYHFKRVAEVNLTWFTFNGSEPGSQNACVCLWTKAFYSSFGWYERCSLLTRIGLRLVDFCWVSIPVRTVFLLPKLFQFEFKNPLTMRHPTLRHLFVVTHRNIRKKQRLSDTESEALLKTTTTTTTTITTTTATNKQTNTSFLSRSPFTTDMKAHLTVSHNMCRRFGPCHGNWRKQNTSYRSTSERLVMFLKSPRRWESTS